MTSVLERPALNDYEPPKKAVRFVGYELTPSEIADMQEKRQGYLEKRGLIDQAALDERGRMVDHFQDRSIWIGVKKPGSSEVEAGGRIILTDGETVDSLQMPLDKIVNPDKEAIAHIRDNPPAQIGEVASLLEFDDPQAALHLYAALKHASTERGVKYWLFGLRARSEKGFNKVLGPALHKIGDSVEIEGATEDLKPYLISIGQGVEAIRESLKDENLDRFTRMTRQLFIDALDQYESNSGAFVAA